MGGSGGIAPWLPSSLSGEGGLLIPPLTAGASLPGARVCPGSWGSLPPAGEPGGGGGGSVSRPSWGGGQGAGGPGGRVASVRPSALAGRATLRASPATLRPWGRCPHTAPVRCGAPPPGVARALVLCAGAGSPVCPGPACRFCCVPLPGVTVLSRGGGTPPRPRGGVGGRRPRGPQAEGEWGGPRRCSLLFRPGRRPVAPGPVPHPLRRTPLGIHGSPGGLGRWARSGWLPVGQCGGGGVPRYGLPPPPLPGGHQGGPPCPRISGRHRAVAAHSVGKCGSEQAADRGRLTRGCVCRGCGASPLGTAAPPGGCGATVSLVGPRPPTDFGGGGFPAVPPPAPWRRPPTAAGGRPGGSGPWAPAADRRGRTLPSPPLGLWLPGPCAGPRPGSLLSPPSSRGVGWPGGGEIRCVLGLVVRVSGQRLAGCGAVGLLSRSVPPSSLPSEVARAPLSHCTVGGGVGRGARLRWGGRPASLSPVPPPRAHRLGRWGTAVTAVVACAGAGAAALAGSASGSASG